MGSAGPPSCSIWNQWSMSVNQAAPPSSATCAVSARVAASRSGPPGNVMFAKWMPRRTAPACPGRARPDRPGSEVPAPDPPTAGAPAGPQPVDGVGPAAADGVQQSGPLEQLGGAVGGEEGLRGRGGRAGDVAAAGE